MPSTQLFVQSGGIQLVSGGIYSGNMLPLVGGIQLRADPLGVSGQPIFICLPNLSGIVPTFNSGGSLSSGGLTDGMPLLAGDSYFVPKDRLVSGPATIILMGPAAASGLRLYWEPM